MGEMLKPFVPPDEYYWHADRDHVRTKERLNAAAGCYVAAEIKSVTPLGMLKNELGFDVLAFIRR